MSANLTRRLDKLEAAVKARGLDKSVDVTSWLRILAERNGDSYDGQKLIVSEQQMREMTYRLGLIYSAEAQAARDGQVDQAVAARDRANKTAMERIAERLAQQVGS
jgi:hypothetical protein